MCEQVIGVASVVSNGTMSEDSYLEILKKVVVSELKNSQLFANTNIICQQDGAVYCYKNVSTSTVKNR